MRGNSQSAGIVERQNTVGKTVRALAWIEGQRLWCSHSTWLPPCSRTCSTIKCSSCGGMPIIGHIWQFQNGFVSSSKPLARSGRTRPFPLANHIWEIWNDSSRLERARSRLSSRHVTQLGSIWAPLVAWSRVAAALKSVVVA